MYMLYSNTLQTGYGSPTELKELLDSIYNFTSDYRNIVYPNGPYPLGDFGKIDSIIGLRRPIIAPITAPVTLSVWPTTWATGRPSPGDQNRPATGIARRRGDRRLISSMFYT